MILKSEKYFGLKLSVIVMSENHGKVAKMVKKVLPDLIKKAFAGRSKNSILQNIEGRDLYDFCHFNQSCSDIPSR